MKIYQAIPHVKQRSLETILTWIKVMMGKINFKTPSKCTQNRRPRPMMSAKVVRNQMVPSRAE